jgi:transcriptional regulator with XRE-family HTH domain
MTSAPPSRAPRLPRRSPTEHDPEALVWARKAKAWRQRELAEKVGISISHMSEIESGSRNAPPHLLQKLAEALNCPVSVLERKRAAV